MDAASLRELQAPLKARYREQPDAAHVRLHAEGSIDADAIACRLD
ncbi:MAG: OsmC family peroxiredoxin, partial [Alphaproteobacteria bacterium]